ncbi:MAG TPA: molybdopterin-dependent oxidoreductase [Candidatus Dormibacteraeota bacterium]
MKRLAGGLLAGLLAGSAVALLEALLRTFGGVSLPSELAGDRILPQVSVDAFLNLLAIAGGPIKAKEMAFWGGFAGVVAVSVAGGVAWELLRRRRRAGRLGLAIVVVFTAGVIAALWPVLGAGYGGLPVTAAAAATALSLLAAAALAAGILRWALPPAATTTPLDSGRRSLLVSGASLVLLAATGGFAARLNADSTFGYDGRRTLVGGRRRQPVTAVDDFYSVTKNLIDPDVNVALWRLEVTGAVQHPYTLTIDELRALTGRIQETTLECISNGIAFGLLSNAVWSGPALRALLDRAQILPSGRLVELRGVDGYVYPLPLERALRDEVLVAHSMNGAPLVRKHGAPARAVIPGAYGEASAKWLTRITVLDHDEEGYYGTQGWRAGFVHTTSVIDQPVAGAVVAAGATALLAGVAFAGDRGVSAVEVSSDGGRSWQPARLDYAGSPTAWVLWSADWTPTAPGPATLKVRAYDGTGKLQEPDPRGIAPSGATGLHQVEVRIA